MSLEGAASKRGRRVLESDLGFRKNQCLVVYKDKILWIGDDRKLSLRKFGFSRKVPTQEISGQGHLVSPGWVEAHTHLVFSGTRSDEFESRLRGTSYQEIAKNGGGILSTMKATRKVSAKQLLLESTERVQKFISQGVSTLEIKSGYGLSFESEVKILQVIQKLKKQRGPRILATFLGPHAKSPEFPTTQEYLDDLLRKLQSRKDLKKLADRADIFIERGFFEQGQAKQYLLACQKLGLDLTIHADQLSQSGGTEVALELKALSADHVLQIDQGLIYRLGQSSTVAVLLPAADFYLRCPYPKARELIDAGACVALATDFNPGSSPTQDLALIGLLARLEMKMTLPEVIAAYTVGASRALGLGEIIGSLEPGKSADFIFSDQGWNEFFYSVGAMSPAQVWSRGKIIFKQN